MIINNKNSKLRPLRVMKKNQQPKRMAGRRKELLWDNKKQLITL
jgi:hypothetical protein